MNSILLLAQREFENSKSDIFPFIFEGHQYWLKKARETKPDILQYFFYKFFPFELLIPPSRKNKDEALKFESTKLGELHKLGINVPNIVVKTDKYFVLEDSGLSINTILKDKNISSDDFYFYVDLVIQELAKIHGFGCFHGGTQLRNLTFKDNKIFFIDFEESFDKDVDIKTLQYRDFLLFLLSFTKIKELTFKIDYERIINRYLELSKNFQFKTKLIAFSKKLSFFLCLFKKDFIKNRVGSDVKYFFELIEILISMEKNAK